MKIKPSDCVYQDFNSEWYKKWGKIVSFPPARHAKFWEQAALCQALDERGFLKTGKRGLGMGVGIEQLVSVFASRGVSVVATDQDPNSNRSSQWDATGQLANGKKSLYYPKIINKGLFNEKVNFQYFDMNTDNKKFYQEFDFIWHNCVIGHLGSMENSRKHLLKSSHYLKENGALIFTTELNISSFELTVSDNSDTIIWRLQDIHKLIDDMSEAGMQAERFRLRLGDRKEDLMINYASDDCYTPGETMSDKLRDPNFYMAKIPFSNFALVPIILVFKKSRKPLDKAKITIANKLDYRANASKLRDHIEKNKLLAEYYTESDSADVQISAINSTRKISAKKGEQKTIELDFRIETSSTIIYDDSPKKPYRKKPLVLSTAKPLNHEGKFKSDDWFSSNRPATLFSNMSIDSPPYYLHDFASHRARSGDIIRYRVTLKAPNTSGTYTESYCPVMEGVADFAKSATVDIFLTVK